VTILKTRRFTVAVKKESGVKLDTFRIPARSLKQIPARVFSSSERLLTLERPLDDSLSQWRVKNLIAVGLNLAAYKAKNE